MRQLKVIFLAMLCSTSYAQDLGNIGKSKPVKVNGGINANTVFYGISGAEARRDPYFWVLNANLNINVLGVDVPFSATITSQESQVAQPFNQYGLSPKYKAFTAHLGWRSLNFSQFTYAGTIFFGAGLDYQPKDLPVYATALYGRFATAIDPLNVAAQQGAVPAFEQWGYGAKVGVRKKGHDLAFMFLKAEDRAGSISKPNPATGLAPRENLVYGLEGKLKVTKTTSLDFEYAQSIFTNNQYLGEQKLEAYTYVDNLGGLMQVNSSTSVDEAYQVGATQRLRWFSINGKYRRLDPNYNSLGTPFINNDFEDITGGVQVPLLKSKVNVSANAGFQRDNLDNTKKDRMTRVIASANINALVTSFWSINLSASNFNSNTYKVRITEIDSLDFFQVTQNAMLSNTFQFKKGATQYSLFTATMLQSVEGSQNTSAQIFNQTAGIQASIAPAKATVSLNGNYFQNIVSGMELNGYGPTLSIGKNFLKSNKLNLRLTSSYIINATAGAKSAETINTGLRGSWKVSEHHTFSVDGSVINKTSYLMATTAFTEFKGGVTYAFVF